MNRIRRILALTAVIYIWTAMSGKDYFGKSQIDISEGLSQPSVTSVIKDSKGVIWIGTHFGLNKFRSGEVKTYFDMGDGKSPVSGNQVYALFLDSGDRLWVSTDKGLSVYDDREDRFELLRAETMLCMLETEERIFFGGYEGLFIYDKKPGVFRHDRTESYSSVVTGIYEYSPGEILILGKGSSLMVYSVESGSIRSIEIPDMAGRGIWQGLMYGNSLILSVFKEGIYCVDPYTGHIKYKCDSSNSGLKLDIVLSMAVYGDRVLLGTDGGGIFVLDPEKGTISSLKEYLGQTEDPLPAASVNCIFVESRESIWAGSVRSGLYNLRQSPIRTFSSVHGIPEEAIIGMYRENSGRVWLASDGGGLCLYDPAADKVTAFGETYGQKVTSVCPFTGGKVLMSVYSSRVFIFDPVSRKQTPFVLVDDRTDYFESQSGYTPVVERISNDEILIFGSEVYRYRLSAGDFAIFHGEEPLAGLRLFGKEDGGSLLAYSYDGIFRLDTSSLEARRIFRVEDGHYISTAAFSEGTIWTGGDYGMTSLQLVTGKTSTLQTGLFRRVTCLKSTSDGMLWIAADHNLFRYFTHTGRLEVMDSGIGLQSKEILCTTQQGTDSAPVYLGFNGGFIQITGGLTPASPENPAPELYEAFVDGGRLYPGDGRIVLPQGYKTFSVTVNLRDDNPFARRRYRFSLDGPVPMTSETFSSTLDIGLVPPGKYSLSASCLLSDGSWGQAAHIISFRLRPPWYHSWYFFLSLAVLTAAVVLIVIRQVNARAKDRLDMERMRQREHYAQERIRFLTQISHEIRTPLTLVYAPLRRLWSNLSGSQYEDTVGGILRNVDKMKDITNIVLDNGPGNAAAAEEFPAWLQAVEDGAGILNTEDSAVADLSSCRILCVEDNTELSALIRSELEHYGSTVFTAGNGREGLTAIRQVNPDVIVSDVMMPELDGYELCRRVKSDVEISHIPIVLLTARGDAASVLNGYKAGADSYLAKPFDTELLVQVIRNLLDSREKIRNSFRDIAKGDISPEKTTFANADETFMEKINELISGHLADADFDVIALASEMAMSRASLYNKLKAITGMGVAQYADTIRIRTACRKLSATDLSIGEISEQLGFGAPRSFSTWFKQKTGQSPLGYRKASQAMD